MSAGKPWEKFYPEAAKNFDADNMPYDNLVHLAAEAHKKYPSRPAFTTYLPNGASATVNFSEFHEHSDNFATYLREVAGLQANDTVALMTANCIAFPIVALGALKANCRLTNINPLYTASELEHQLQDSGAKVLAIIDLFGDKVDAVVKNTKVEKVIKLSLLEFFPFLKKAIIGFVMKKVKKAIPDMNSPHITLADAMSQGGAAKAQKNIDVSAYTKDLQKDDIAIYQYTGGTTGRSKGAELTHRNVLANAEQAAVLTDHLANKNGDTVVVALPLYHITAFALNLMPTFSHGNHAIMIPSPRPPSNLQTVFENNKVTWFTGINTLFAALLEEPWFDKKLFENISMCGSGGAAQHEAVAERWEAQTGVPIYQGYGMTECAGVMTLNPIGHNRLGTVGVPVPGVDIKIINDEGEEQPVNTPGQLLCKSPTVMKGYHDRPDATAEALKDGWLHTGDVAQVDEDGFVRIVDRLNDMILVSGFNVFPNEVEDAIAKLEGVVEVGVVGIADEKTAEAVKAFVVVSDKSITAEKVIEHCREHLTNYKVPKNITFIDEIPKTPVGKVLRRELRDM